MNIRCDKQQKANNITQPRCTIAIKIYVHIPVQHWTVDDALPYKLMQKLANQQAQPAVNSPQKVLDVLMSYI